MTCEQQRVRPKASPLDVRREFRGDLRAELELPVLLVLGVADDEKPPAVRMKPLVQLDDLPAHSEDAANEIYISYLEFRQFAPAEAGFDGRLDE